MSYKPCAKPGCPEILCRGVRFCKFHMLEFLKNAYRKYSEGRESSNLRGYDSKWNAFRRKYISKHMLSSLFCRMCGAPFLSTSDIQLDHIQALNLGGDKFDVDNLQVLCRTCHAKKSQQEKKLINQNNKNTETQL